jgi:hypothetical protein
MTVTVEDELWNEMKRHHEIRWSAVMKDAAREKLKALAILQRLAKKTHLSEKEIEKFAIELGRKVNRGAA